ncbi:uncharacterized protein DS421_16g553690 [Arachis hypogaea]|nr:uncharacterized protein DS421_16g553690 [Arachis hypogaea]
MKQRRSLNWFSGSSGSHLERQRRPELRQRRRQQISVAAVTPTAALTATAPSGDYPTTATARKPWQRRQQAPLPRAPPLS